MEWSMEKLRALGLYSEPYTTSLPPPLSSQGSVVFDCFEAALGAEVRLWSYTQPRYQKELNLTQQLPGKWPQSLRGPKSCPPPVSFPSGHCHSAFTPFLVPSTHRQGSELPSSPGLSLLSPLPRQYCFPVPEEGALGTGLMGWCLRNEEPFPVLPMGWIAPLLSLVPSPTGGFSVISPQTARGLKSGTASRAAGVGAMDSGAGRREGQGLEREGSLEVTSGVGLPQSDAH